jgi:tetratricopeptide (TPR) repeat protein/TolB-like protein/predicted Ser/Thr protein kinase
MELERGSRLGHYEVRDRLGKGGMGEVYRAHDTRLNRDVAIKVLPADLARDGERRMRFEREAQAVAALNHPNIVTIHGVEREGEAHFIIMELVEGRTLTQLIPQGGIPLDRMFDVAVPLADALAAAHGKGITHRDLKPDNVMVTEDGRVKVLDFGLAKLVEPGDAVGTDATATVTAEGKILGTVAYMSPEQAEGRPIDARSDVFSLGVLLYEMASGIRPFEGDTRISTLTAILRDTPSSLTDVRQNLPRHLSRIVNHCLAKEPDRRYQSALDVRNELDELRREVSSGELEMASSHSGITPAPSLPSASARPRIGPLVGVLAIVAIAVVLAVWWFGRGTPDPTAGADAKERSGAVAVLGFENLGDADDTEQLGRMLIGLITTGLADSGGIEVVSSAKVLTSLKEAGAGAGGFDPTLAAAAARIAGAETMVVGQVIRNDDRMLLTVELVDVASGNTLGSMRAEGRGKADLFAMAGKISTDVRGKLGPGPAAEGLAINLAQSLTDSPEAYGLYAAGEIALHERRFEDAIEQLTQAIRLDPTFALAYYELATAQFWHGDRAGALRNLHNGLQYVDRLPPRWRTTYQAVIDYEAGSVDNAYAALENLIAESPGMPDPYNYLGEILTHYSKYQDWLRAKELFARALELDPTYKVVLFHLSEYVMMFDGFDGGRALLDRYPDERDPAIDDVRIRLLSGERRFSDLVALEQDPLMADSLNRSPSFQDALLRTGEVERALELSRVQLEESVGYSKGLALWYDALLRFRIGSFRQALENLALAPGFFDGPVVHALGAETCVSHAWILEMFEDLDAAVDRARHARELDYFHGGSRFETARLLFSAGRTDEGDREIEGLEGLAQDSRSPLHDCWLTLARAERQRASGRPAEAQETLRRDVPPVCLPSIRFAREHLLAQVAEDAGDLESALDHYRNLLAPSWMFGEVIVVSDIPALYHVARLEQRAGNADEARRLYREFLGHWGAADMPVPIVQRAREQLVSLGGN